jgi:hypothetical protein
MSQLNLSNELINEILNSVTKHDDQAKSNILVCAQYLAAVLGLILGNENIPSDKKKELLNELNAFSHHVLDDVIANAQQKTPASSTEEASGVWRPTEDK